MSFLVLTEGQLFIQLFFYINHGYFSVVLPTYKSILYYLFGNSSVEIQSILIKPLSDVMC